MLPHLSQFSSTFLIRFVQTAQYSSMASITSFALQIALWEALRKLSITKRPPLGQLRYVQVVVSALLATVLYSPAQCAQVALFLVLWDNRSAVLALVWFFGCFHVGGVEFGGVGNQGTGSFVYELLRSANGECALLPSRRHVLCSLQMVPLRLGK